MLLAIDIGNTNLVLGLRALASSPPKPKAAEEREFMPCWRLATAQERTADEYSALLYTLFQKAGITFAQVKGVALCCVVPNLQNTFVDLIEKSFQIKPIVIGPGIKMGMPILYDHPKEVGADRIVNAIAAYYRFQKACIIADFGTATTFDFVTAAGEYAGGVIAPGIQISAQALFHRAAKLPQVEIVAPEQVIGRNTVHSMQSGLYFGNLGMADRIIEEILRESRLKEEEVAIVATGGLAPLLARGSKHFKKVIPFLTLEGLEIVYYLNKNR